jgi:hypothetical protein
MATMGQGMPALIDAVCGVMTDLAIHPLALEIDGHGARVLAVMPERALVRRSRGPYDRDNLPPEVMAVVEWVALRWSGKLEQPEFTIEGGGMWPALVLELHPLRVMVRYVVPEQAPPVHQPERGNVTLSIDVKMALELVGRSLATAAAASGSEPPVSLALSYPDDPDYERNVAAVPADFRRAIPPVVPTIEVDRSRCTPAQRSAHDAALRAVVYTDQQVEPLGDQGFTTRLGSARIQDRGD